jgi:glutamate carboxypeptidase
MKAGFIQALYALKDIPDAHNRVALLGTTDEEIESLKSRQLIQSLARTAHYALILEPSFEGNVKTRRKGAGMYTVTVHGLAAHAGLDPEKGVNASVEIAALVPKIVSLSNPINGTTVTPTVIRSGVTTNTIPDLATLEIDCRSFSSDELVEIDAKIRSFKPENPLASIVVNGAINRPPLEVGASEVLFEKLSSMTKRLGLEEIGQSAVGGVSDGNLTAAEGTMTLDGLGAVGGGAHAKSEHVIISQIPKRIQILHELLKDLLQEVLE